MNKKNVLLMFTVAIVIFGGGFFLYNSLVDSPSGSDEKKTDITQEDVVALAATLAYQQGDVQVKVNDSDWQAVETDTVFHVGDSIKTGTDSKAIIELENGDVVRLGYDTEIFLTSMNQDAVTVTQIAGASYNRVAKNQDRVYEVKTGTASVEALGTAFDVLMGPSAIDVNVVESTVKVVTTQNEQAVTEGESATLDASGENVEVKNMDKNKLTNEWYTWNKEEDSKKTEQLGVLSEYAGPEITVTSPAEGASIAEGQVTVAGAVSDPDAKLTLNGDQMENNAGTFSQAVTLASGKNMIAVTATDAAGHKTIKEIKVFCQILASATPLHLEAETQADGVHLAWNATTNGTFLYYKVVRSVTNADLKYPDDGYIAKLAKGTESFTDTDVSADGTYYYRVCEVLSGDRVFCSNVAHMKGKEQAEEKNAEAETNESGITLSGAAETDGVHLSWTVTGLTIESGFKVVKSDGKNPVYPGNDFQYLTDSSARSYTWALADGLTYHFRVCQYDGNGKCLAYSNDLEITAKKTVAASINLIMTVKAEDTGVGIWWTNASSLAGFKYYKVVRSETNANLKYPDDGYIAAKSKGELSHRDYSAVNGKSYYYRVCAVGSTTVCSNVAQVTAINDNSAPTAVSLSGAYADGKIVLTWSESAEKDFKYYKIVWSQTKSDAAYPADGYLGVVSTVGTATYTDEGAKGGSRSVVASLAVGTHYYRVCVVDQADQVACSNTVTAIDGIIQ
ncbi:MAG: FecR domain-containing protein [Patescibacteria group bacterium]